jgi:exodeoxyribonuclease VII large subunit
VQDRHAAPRVAGALRDLAATGAVDVIVVARGGGSLTDLLAFSDEALCRTVALLAVPVIASIGHHTDRTLLDEVAAASCSTPTHAAEVAVPLDCAEAGGVIAAAARRLRRHSRTAVVDRARLLAALSRAPTEHLARHRRALHRQACELLGASGRRLAGGRAAVVRDAVQLARRHEGALRDMRVRRPPELERLAIALSAHDPERTLARGYALVEDPAGEPLASAAAARAQGDLRLRFADGRVAARVAEDDR